MGSWAHKSPIGQSAETIEAVGAALRGLDLTTEQKVGVQQAITVGTRKAFDTGGKRSTEIAREAVRLIQAGDFGALDEFAKKWARL